MSTIAEMAEKFEKLLNRLPAGIRTPVQKEWQPLNALFLQRRAPRLVIVGNAADAFLHEVLFPSPARSLALKGDKNDKDGKGEKGEKDQTAQAQIPGWDAVHHAGTVLLHVATEHPQPTLSALRQASADCFILTQSREESPEAFKAAQALLLQLQQANAGAKPSGSEKGIAPVLCFTKEHLSAEESAALWEELEPELLSSVQAVLPFGDRPTALRAIGKTLPQQGQLEFARATGERTVQREIAQSLIRSTTAVCTAIGTQPIPLADFPILSSLQFMMIAGIIHISGREWKVSTVRDFLAALGFNVGAGLLLREGARSAIKLLPGFLNLISGALAGAGTYGIGFAASAYFIDGLGIAEARKQIKLGFRRKKPPLPGETVP